MDSQIDYWTARALLEWQVELGATEAIGDAPVDRYALGAQMPKPKPITAQAVAASAAKPVEVDPVAEAERAVAGVRDLDGLRTAMQGFEHCALKRGARNFVFADGAPSARVMVIGEAPGREEDVQGKPFVGPAGQLLDRMFAAIGMARSAEGAAGVYITNVVPWRPPQNRDPNAREVAMMLPFLRKHIELAQPDVLVLMGGVACEALLRKSGIIRLRGTWDTVDGRPALPMLHPAYLLRTPLAKRDAWADLLSLQARLREMG